MRLMKFINFLERKSCHSSAEENKMGKRRKNGKVKREGGRGKGEGGRGKGDPLI